MIKMTYVIGANQTALKQIKVVQGEWKKALREERGAILTEYRKTYHNWQSLHRPNENTNLKTSGDEWYVEIRLTGRIYWFVHESIDRLRAVFSGPKDPAGKWKAKTEPRVLASGPGSGRMVYASKAIDLDPYEAREFTDKVIDVRKPEYHRRMEHATQEGARKATQGG